jgi:hypothetical protein
MHYIIGTKFIKSGREFSLYNIVPKDNKFLYMFKENTGEMLELEFSNTRHADRYIASARKETLPDYDKYHGTG